MFDNLWKWVRSNWGNLLTIVIYILGFLGTSVIEAKDTCTNRFGPVSDQKLEILFLATVWPVYVVVVSTEVLMETANPNLKEQC